MAHAVAVASFQCHLRTSNAVKVGCEAHCMFLMTEMKTYDPTLQPCLLECTHASTLYIAASYLIAEPFDARRRPTLSSMEGYMYPC